MLARFTLAKEKPQSVLPTTLLPVQGHSMTICECSVLRRPDLLMFKSAEAVYWEQSRLASP